MSGVPGISWCLLACTWIGTSSLMAQTPAVWPAPYGQMAGEGMQNTPFSPSPIPPNTFHPPEARAVTLCAAATLPFGQNTVIRGVAWRRDAVHNTPYSANSGHITIRMATVADAGRPKTRFEEMFANVPAVVHDGPVQVPTAPPPGTGPAPFSIVVPFQFPWTYPGGDLALDVSFLGQGPGIWRRDAVQLGDHTHAAVTPLGPGCLSSSGHTPLHWVDAATAFPGSTMDLHLEGGPLAPNTLGSAHLLGTGASNHQGLPLPFDLGLIGLPGGCMLRTNIVANFVVPPADFSTLYSRSRLSLPIPNAPVFTGLQLSGQWMVLDLAKTTAIQAVMSSAERWTVGARMPAASAAVLYGRTVWAHGRSRDVPAHGGRLGPRNYVAVTRFDI